MMGSRRTACALIAASALAVAAGVVEVLRPPFRPAAPRAERGPLSPASPMASLREASPPHPLAGPGEISPTEGPENPSGRARRISPGPDSAGPDGDRPPDDSAKASAPDPAPLPGGSHLYVGWERLDAALRLLHDPTASWAEAAAKAAQLERSEDVARKRGTIVGRLETVDARAIAGWAYAWDEPGTDVWVEVHIDGRPFTLVHPEGARPAFVEADPTNPRARRAWAIATPPELLDGDKHWVDAFAFRTGDGRRFRLADSPRELGGQSWPRAEVQWVDEHIVYGWAVDPDDPKAPVTVDLVVDGELTARLTTAGPGANAEVFARAQALSPERRVTIEGDALTVEPHRSLLVGNRPIDAAVDEVVTTGPGLVIEGPAYLTKFHRVGPDAHAFLHAVPPDRPIRGAGFVQVLVSKKDGTLRREAARSPYLVNGGNRLPYGGVAFVNEVQVSGWVVDDDALPAPIAVDVYIDGEYFGRVRSDQRFAALPNSVPLPGPDYAWIFKPPPRYVDGKAHTIQVFAVNEPRGVNPELRGSPVTFVGRRNSPPVGWVDRLDFDLAAGWAYDPDADHAPIDVQVWIDDALFATVRAADTRQDLVPIVSAEAEHGWHVAMPPGLRDGKHHTVRVLAVNVPEGPPGELARSPVELNAQEPWLGISVDDSHPAGVRVTGVLPASPAEAAGIRADDVIVSFDATEGKVDVAAFVAWVKTKEVGERVVLRLLRPEAGEIEVVATVGARPS